MSSLHNNARRHRQMLKKRAINDLNVNEIKKRSPPLSRVGNPPTESTDVPPIGAPTQNPNPPETTNPPPGGNPNPPPQHSTVAPHSPVTPNPPAQTPPTTPRVPVNSQPGTSVSQPAPPPVPSVTTSSTPIALSTSIPDVVSTPPTIPPTTQILPTDTGLSVSNTFIVPSVTDNPLSNTISVPTSSATDASTDSDGLSTGSVVGIVAAGLVAVAAIVVVGMWLAKRYFRKRDEDEFSRNSFIRQSVHIPDDADDFSPPRPPTMIARHNGAFSPQPHTSYASSGMYPQVSAMHSTQPGEMVMHDQAPHANPFAESNPNYGMHQQQQPALVRVPSNGSAQEYTGGDNQGAPGSSMATYPGSAQSQYEQYPNQGPGYADLTRGSVTPYQAAQYAEISRQLNIGSAANSPISPSFAQSQSYGQNSAFAAGGSALANEYISQQEHHDPAFDSGRLPTPAPMRIMSPNQQGGSGPEQGPQRVVSPASMPVGGYSFPMPISATSPPPQAPGSVAHAAAMAALGNAATNPSAPASGKSAAIPAHLHAGAARARPATFYEEEDAYGGM